MSGEVKQFISDFGKSVEQMKAQTPDLVGGFGGLFAKVMKAGASRQEVLEAAGVVVMMQGGPAYVYIPEVIKILDELEAK